MSDLGPQIVAGVTGLVGAVVGLAGGVAVERIRSAESRQARAEARQQQRDEFQRQTLIDFQEAIGRYARAAGRAWHHDEMVFRQTGRWATTLLGEDVDRELFESGRDARQQIERIRDDEVRTRFAAYHSAQSQDAAPLPRPGQTDSQAHDAAVARHWEIARLQQALEERLGQVLRNLL